MELRSLFIITFGLPLFLCSEDTYHESLKMKVIGNEQVYSFFNFTTNWDVKGEFNKVHYNLFPRSIGQLVQKYQIAELHFTMTQGLWRYQLWGFPLASAPTGAQVWVWFKKGTKDVDKKWIGFTNALSGMFCASLNLMNKAVSVTPKVSFRPTGVLKDGELDNSLLRYGSLSRENLCTENLTPWLKLLPCASKQGPSSLLNPSGLHHSRYLSIGLHYHSLCHNGNCDAMFVQLQQHVSVVNDIRTSLDKYPNFSFVSLFDRSIEPGCPIAETSTLTIKSPNETIILPAMDKSYGENHMNLHDLKSKTNVKVSWRKLPGLSVSSSIGVMSHCYITGIGLEGGITCSITNHEKHNVTIIFYQVIPWFLYAQLHTLSMKTEKGEIIEPSWLSFTPAVIRGSPHTLELVATLPRSSIASLSIDFTRGFMTWTEHPPDANHGFYIQPAVITLLSTSISEPHLSHRQVEQVYSEALLVNIPVPDFSMPYNVICLVCTVLAIAFGSIHNLTTRRLQVVPESLPSSLIEKIHSKLRKVLSKISFKKKVEESTTETSE